MDKVAKADLKKAQNRNTTFKKNCMNFLLEYKFYPSNKHFATPLVIQSYLFATRYHKAYCKLYAHLTLHTASAHCKLHMTN